MMCDSFEGQKHITVYETTLTIQQNTLSVFNIIIKSSESTVSLIRYPFDLLEFHQKIRFYYPKVKISFPSLTNPPREKKTQENLRNLKRRSLIRGLLSITNRKSNADKIEKYLEKCFQHPIISISSILRDFTSVQRDEDANLTSQHTSTTLTPTINTVTKVSMEPVKLIPPEVIPPLPTKVKIPQQPSMIIPSITIPTEISHNNNNVILSTLTSSDHVQKDENSLTPLADYNLLKVLGKGCMGKVLLVESKSTKQLYALKSIKKKWVLEQKELIHTKTERDILVQLRNQPFIANLNHVYQTPSELFIILDYYAGGDIATQLSIMTKFSKERTKFYAAEIIQGLEILHQHGIVYRDLKPENVLIGRDGHIVLTDFGLSKIFTPDDLDEYDCPSTRTFCGTAEYLAPEILLGEQYTYVVDFWSLGTLLYEMLAGTTPFWAEVHMDMYKRVLEDKLEFPPNFDAITIDFLAGLLEKDPIERLGWGEEGIEDIKTHPYFYNIDWNMVKQKKLVPPFIPTLKSEKDYSNFDEIFTNLPVSISQSSGIDVKVNEKDPFEGFSYHSPIRVRKRTSDAISLTANSSNHITHNNRIKKRQTSHNMISLSNSQQQQCPSGQLRSTHMNHSTTISSLFLLPPSNASTVNNSLCSYLTLDN